MRGWITSRFMLIALVLALLVGAWNLYVAAHAHGMVTGQVVDATGRPVAGAVVHMFGRDFVSEQERGHVLSDSNGGFRFDSNASHVVQLQAEKAGQKSPRMTIRLWFRAQDVDLMKPLVLR